MPELVVHPNIIVIIVIIIIIIIIIIITSETGKQYYNYYLIISNTPLIKLEPVFHNFKWASVVGNINLNIYSKQFKCFIQ